MKKIIEKILGEFLKRLLNVLVDALERMLNTDLDGDGDIAGKREEE